MQEVKTETRHHGTQKPMPVSPEVENMLLHVAMRSINESSHDIVDNAVVVTGCDHSHYAELEDTVASYQTQYPGRKLLFYDFGLTKQQQINVSELIVS